MEVNKIQNSNTSFGIRVAQSFITAAHNHYNYNEIRNKKQNIYLFNSVVDKFEKYGYNNYALEYRRIQQNGNWQHYLVAVRDDGDREVIISQRNTLLRLIDKFMKMNKHEINNKLRNR